MFKSICNSKNILAIGVAVLALSGCGGSGGGGVTSPPPPPPPPPPPANVAPSANAGPDQVVSSLDPVTLDGSGSSDSDGTIATYAWTQTGGAMVMLSDATVVMPTFNAPNVGADEILTFDLVVTDDDGAASVADTVTITINPTLALPFNDDFNDGNADGWSFFDDNTTNASSWDAASGRLVQAGPTAVLSADLDETYRRGTYALLDDSINLTNYRLSVSIDPRPSTNSVDDLGVMFRYTDNDHYYRFSMNAETGSSRLESKAGVDLGGAPIWRTLAHDLRGYEPDQSIALEINVDGPLIQVFVNDDHLFSARDTDHAQGGVAMYTRDGMRFDNVSITPSGTDPEVVIATPVANTVIPNGPRNINVIAIARNIPAGGSVNIEFLGGAACGAVTETNAGEFTASCAARPVGNWTVRARILDNGGGEVDRDSNDGVFIGTSGMGDRYDAIGDSLTLGLFDNYQRDNLNLADRKTISTRGWTGPLSDLLTATRGEANLVGNEGISGDRSDESRLLRLASILERNRVPRSNRAIIMLGTNDANIGINTPSGEGCTIGVDCDGTYKGHIADMIGQLQGMGRDTVILTILPPVFGNSTSQVYADPLDAGNARQNNVLAYNRVIVNELSALPGVALGPDLFSCFLTATNNRFSLFEDSLHMNSLGYAFVASLMNEAITGSPAVPNDPCTPPADIYILESLDGTVFKQNLLEPGDQYYIDEVHTLTGVPAALEDGVWIEPTNANAADVSAGYLSFDVGATPVTVYIAHDPDGGPPSSSTNVFVPSLVAGLTVSDPNITGGELTIVEAVGVTGTVTLGGPATGGAGLESYLVIVVP